MDHQFTAQVDYHPAIPLQQQQQQRYPRRRRRQRRRSPEVLQQRTISQHHHHRRRSGNMLPLPSLRLEKYTQQQQQQQRMIPFNFKSYLPPPQNVQFRCVSILRLSRSVLIFTILCVIFSYDTVAFQSSSTTSSRLTLLPPINVKRFIAASSSSLRTLEHSLKSREELQHRRISTTSFTTTTTSSLLPQMLLTTDTQYNNKPKQSFPTIAIPSPSDDKHRFMTSDYAHRSTTNRIRHSRTRGVLGFQIHSKDEVVSSTSSSLASTMQEHPKADISEDNQDLSNGSNFQETLVPDYHFPSFYDVDSTSSTSSKNKMYDSSIKSSISNISRDAINSRQLSANLISRVDSMAWNLPQPLIGTTTSSLSSSAVTTLEEGDTTTSFKTSAIEVPWIPSEDDIDQLTVVQLKSELGLRDLKKVGNKYLLQNRFKEWIQQSRVDPLSSTNNVRRRRRDQSTTTISTPASSSSIKVTSFLENDLPAWGVESSSLRRNNDDNIPLETKDYPIRSNDTSMEEPLLLNVDSLQEWARTVDLEPLLQRREAIHRDKLVAPPKQSSTSSVNQEFPSDLRKVIQKMFDQPSSIYSNWEVKQMYAAAKHADQMGNRVLSKRILYELKTATPNDARIYRRIARMELEDNDVAVARAVLHEGIQLHPDNAYLWHGLGQLEGSLGNITAQRIHYEKAIEVDPYVPNSYHALGIMEHTNGRIAKAMKVLKKGIYYCPTNHRLHHALGDIYRDAKLLPLANKSYQKAIQHGPLVSHGFAYTALSYVAYEEGNIDQCRHYLRKAVHLNNGRHANGWVALAQMEESEGNIDAARTACMVGIGQYERGLIEQSRRTIQKESVNTLDRSIKNGRNTLSMSENPVTLRNKILQSIPTYRSGDRFFNVYRNWLRLEERYGTIDTFEEVYERAIVAFPHEYKIMIDAAQHFVRLNLYTKARDAFTKACNFRANHPNINADPFRLFAEFEMQLGNYVEAQNILYSGAMALSKYLSSSMITSQRGLPQLFLTWAVCEWHLNNPTHTEKLFEYALRLLSTDVADSPKLRSTILYTIARFEYDRLELRRAQHYIGLCLRENALPGGDGQVWDLWATVAYEMGNIKLAHQCQEQSSSVRLNGDCFSTTDDAIPSLSDTLKSSIMHDQPDMYQLIRRDPWHPKIFPSTSVNDRNDFLSASMLPHSTDKKIASLQNR